jgi:hypothetical protein
MTAVTLGPGDEWLHTPEAVPGWQENWIFVGLDAATGTGFYVHLGRLPDLDRYDVKVAVAVGGKVVSTSPSRPLEDAAKDDLAGPGLEVAVLEPFRRWRVRYDGVGRPGLTDDLLCVDAAGEIPLQLDVTVEALGPALDMAEGMRLLADQGNDGGHYEQGLRWRGTARAGGTTVDAGGLAVRDHSWGVRHLAGINGVWWAPMVFDEGPTQLGGIKLLAGGEAVRFAFRQDGPGPLGAFRHFALDIADADHATGWDRTRLRYGDPGEAGSLEVTAVRCLRLPIAYPEGWGMPFVSDETLCTVTLDDGRSGFGIVEWNGPLP